MITSLASKAVRDMAGTQQKGPQLGSPEIVRGFSARAGRIEALWVIRPPR
ncbi:MAG: hypothetical protein AB1679_00950 [Actinomycetota bacterium]